MLRSLLRQSAVYGVSGTLPRIASIILVPVLTRWLTPSQYGTLTVCTIIGGLAAAFMMVGLDTALPRFYLMPEEEEGDRESAVFTIVTSAIVSGLVVFAVLQLAGPLVFPWLMSADAFPFYPYVTLVLVSAVAGLPVALLQRLNFARQRPGTYAAIQLYQTVLSTGLVLVFVVVAGWGVIGSLGGTAVAALTTVPLAVVMLARHMRRPFSRRVMRRAFLFGLPLIPHFLFGWALNFSDRLILERYVSLPVVGVYSVGYSLAMTLMLVTMSLNQAMTPMYYKLAEARDFPPVVRITSAMMVASGAAAVTLTLFSAEVVALFAGDDFQGAVRYMPILVGGFFLQAVYFDLSTPIFFRMRTRIVPILSGSAAAANVTLNLLLIPHYGPMVAAWTTVLAYAVTGFGSWIIGYRLQPEAFDLGKLVRVTLLTAAFWAVAVPLQRLPAFAWWEVLLKLAVLGLAVGAAFALRVATRDDVRSALQTVGLGRGPRAQTPAGG